MSQFTIDKTYSGKKPQESDDPFADVEQSRPTQVVSNPSLAGVEDLAPAPQKKNPQASPSEPVKVVDNSPTVGAEGRKTRTGSFSRFFSSAISRSRAIPGDSQPPQQKTFAHELIEAEKRFQEGLTSLKDIIAPAAVKINPNDVQINGVYARSFFVLAYPRYLSSNWLTPIIDIDMTMDISMFIYPLDNGEILKKLRSKVGQIQSSITIAQEKGDVRDPMLETAFRDVEELRDKLMQGTEHYFRFALYFTIYGKNSDELEKSSSVIESMLGSKLIVTKKAFLQGKQGFDSTLPLGQDMLAVSSNLNTEPLSSVFPFVSSDLTSNDGILYGINMHNNSLILFDRFQMENANMVVFAKSGAGKSYAVKLEILRSLMAGVDVIVIDPELEYKHLCESVG